jgi:hypothetical protein
LRKLGSWPIPPNQDNVMPRLGKSARNPKANSARRAGNNRNCHRTLPSVGHPRSIRWVTIF